MIFSVKNYKNCLCIFNRQLIIVPFVFLFFSAALSGKEQAPREQAKLFDMSIEELMNVEVTVASKKPVSIRQTPGIVTVITREDILNSGASDLLEILTIYVPGITFGVDVEGAVGIGMRGLWAHEGKVLLLIDGQEANEEMFATTVFGNHYPAEIIERIEIIRGPGSAIYGGYAAVGVINVTTRGVNENGAWISGLYSQMEKTYSRRNIAAGFGKRDGDWGIGLSTVVGQGMRSDRDMVDIVGNSRSLNGNSELNPLNVNFNGLYKGLDVRAIVDKYHTTQIDLWDENYAGKALRENWNNYFFNVKYSFKDVAGRDLTIIPEWKYKIQYPWQLSVPETFTNGKHSEKMQFGLTSIWDITERLNLVSGIEYYTNYLYLPHHFGEFEETFQDEKTRIGYQNFAAYSQLMIFSDIVNVTVGGRLDKSNKYGSSFVPRIGLTRAWDRFHAKAIYSRSFRIPAGNIPNSIPPGFPDIEPENGNNYEAEFGYRLKDNMMFTMDFFDVSFDKAIVYLQDTETGTGSYFNSGKYGSRGIESEYRYNSKTIDLLCNYAFYEVTQNDVEAYDVPGHEHSFLAFPQHRFNILADIKVSDKTSIIPSVSFFGKRYGYAYNSSAGEATLQDFDATFVCNLNFRARDAFRKGLEMDFGVRDMFNSGYKYIQPYNGGHAPLPAPSRTIYAGLSYKF